MSPSFRCWPRNWPSRWLRGALLGSLTLLGSSALRGEESPPPLPPSLVVLQYHFVATETPASTSVTPAQFAAHLEAIEASGATVLPLAEALAALQAGRTLPETALAITFLPFSFLESRNSFAGLGSEKHCTHASATLTTFAL